ncbi:exonuclease SbcCD subunit D C-terminal domain-containing protein [candidate division KSB1 bacterium]|nr:exonuclease SbcCD subunit D C-terminal domain-containing protein [candidate division KSB1 bacterium]
MRFLHTADWHLGHHLCDKDREEEHSRFLDFLLHTIHEQAIDVLLIAGDIFDNANPPNSALRMYYNFLKSLTQTHCKQTVIIGGNHDSVSTLNAPRALLQSFNISVIGGATENLQDEIIEVKDDSGIGQAVICAVPYLRDRDIRNAVADELYEEREKRIKQGIATHYSDCAKMAQENLLSGCPFLATGHLYAAGARTSDSEKDIHIGNLGQITADAFPKAFDYVALGHLHRPQKVGGEERIRYSGSPVPLSFSEIDDKKQVLLIEFEGKNLLNITPIDVPVVRRLRRFKGSIAQVQTELELFENGPEALQCWAEVQLELDKFTPDADEQVRSFAADKNLQILKVSATYTSALASLAEQTEIADLSELKVMDVFTRRCEGQNLDEADQQEMTLLFSELLSDMEQEKTR